MPASPTNLEDMLRSLEQPRPPPSARPATLRRTLQAVCRWRCRVKSPRCRRSPGHEEGARRMAGQAPGPMSRKAVRAILYPPDRVALWLIEASRAQVAGDHVENRQGGGHAERGTNEPADRPGARSAPRAGMGPALRGSIRPCPAIGIRSPASSRPAHEAKSLRQRKAGVHPLEGRSAARRSPAGVRPCDDSPERAPGGSEELQIPDRGGTGADGPLGSAGPIPPAARDRAPGAIGSGSFPAPAVTPPDDFLHGRLPLGLRLASINQSATRSGRYRDALTPSCSSAGAWPPSSSAPSS